MFKSVRGRLLVILTALSLSGWYMYQTYQSAPEEHKSPVKLGLDLQGGMHLVLEISDPDGTMPQDVKDDYTDQALIVIRNRIDELGVAEPLIQKVGTDRIIVELPGVTDPEQAKNIVRRSARLEWRMVLPTTDIQSDLPRLDRVLVATLGEDELRQLGATEQTGGLESPEDILFPGADSGATDTTAATATDSTQASEPDSTSAVTLRPFTELLRTGDIDGTFRIAESDRELVERFLSMPEFRNALPRGVDLLLSSETVTTPGAATFFRRLYVVEDEAFIDGSNLENAIAGRDQQFQTSQVQFELDRPGGRTFGRITSQHVGDYIAIVLDGQVMSAPVILDRIGARGQIDLQDSPLEEARDLALVLRAGALPASLEILEERTVGPSLGQDSINQGEVAGIVGLAFVLLIMIGYYRVAGMLAIGALTIYVVLVMGGLAMFGATLTLPGLAGIVLSIGMGVDANVLIFERIREELAVGRATRTAVEEGFGNALSAIVDANLTTLITALILFQFGTGPVRGFAVTLSIGILASFFSALYVTRTFFLIYLSGKKASDPISI